MDDDRSDEFSFGNSYCAYNQIDQYCMLIFTILFFLKFRHLNSIQFLKYVFSQFIVVSSLVVQT